MTRSKKNTLGLLALAQTIMLIATIWMAISSMRDVFDFAIRMEALEHEGMSSADEIAAVGEVFTIWGKVMIMGILLGVLSLVNRILYILEAAKNKGMETGERVIWIITLILFGYITVPLYWIIRIRPEPEVQLNATSPL